MLKELQSWWQNAAPETQAIVWDGSVVLVALLGGHIIGKMVARSLRAHSFDAAFRPWGSSSPHYEADRGFTPATVVGLLVRLTAWAAAAWWLARRYDRPDVADALALVGGRIWVVVAILGATLLLAGLLARRVMECLQGPAPGLPQARPSAAPHHTVPGAVGAGVYGLVVLVALLTAADYYDWPLTRTAALGLWQLTQTLLYAGAALLVGALGIRWSRDLATHATGASPHQRTAQSTALGIMAGTTGLAAGVLLFAAGVRLGLALIVVVGVLAWLARGHLSNLLAGLRLRANKVGTVWFDGGPWQVSEVGWLETEVGRGGEYSRLPNRQVLEASAHAAPAAAIRH
jgi:hypothetical protein